MTHKDQTRIEGVGAADGQSVCQFHRSRGSTYSSAGPRSSSRVAGSSPEMTSSRVFSWVDRESIAVSSLVGIILFDADGVREVDTCPAVRAGVYLDRDPYVGTSDEIKARHERGGTMNVQMGQAEWAERGASDD
mgnify:CR=1 FL=1